MAETPPAEHLNAAFPGVPKRVLLGRAAALGGLHERQSEKGLKTAAGKKWKIR